MTAAQSAGQSWLIRVAFAGEWLTDNDRRRPIVISRSIRAWRESVVVACRQARLPLGVTPVTIHAVCWYAGRTAPVRDRANLGKTIKAIVDGLPPARDWTRGGKSGRTVGYGLIPDDSDRHVKATTWELRKSPTGQPWVDLTITKLVDAVPGDRCCALGYEHDGACVVVCSECNGSQRCRECGDHSVEDFGGCGSCDGAGGCSYCYEGMQTDDCFRGPRSGDAARARGRARSGGRRAYDRVRPEAGVPSVPADARPVLGPGRRLPDASDPDRASRDPEPDTRPRGSPMSVTSDPRDPRLTRGADPADGPPVEQAPAYLILSDEERARGFVRPLRTAYWHTVCGAITTMNRAIAETYAAQPTFYGATYCATCRQHRPVGADGEFHWCDPANPDRQSATLDPKVGT